MSSDYSRDRKDTVHNSQPPFATNVDDALSEVRTRMSLLKNHVENLNLDILQSADLDVQDRGPSNNPINRSVDGRSSPRSDFSGDLPELMGGNKSYEKSMFRASSREESMELDSQWRESEAGTYSDDPYHPIHEAHDGSSCSSRSWSNGRRSIGFGTSTADQLLLKNLTRSSHPSRRRYEATIESDLDEELRQPPPRRRDGDFESQQWIVKNILASSCWPKEEESQNDLRLTGRDGSFTRMTNDSRRTSIKKSVRVPNHSLAFRSVIGKMWDDCCLEVSHDMWHLIIELLSNTDNGRIDPESCWISGRAASSTSEGLPFAFTIHTYSSKCKPCTFGHANILAEITFTSGSPMDHVIPDRGHNLDLAPMESYADPEPISPSTKLPWTQLTLSQSFSLLPQVRSQDRSEVMSTFSFDQTAQRQRNRDEVQIGGGEMATETISTADLTQFTRTDVHQRGASLHSREEQSPAHNTGTSSREESRSAVFCEDDLIWEMHYPEFTELDTVIASRKYQLNDEKTGPRTYIGDTDSDADVVEREPLSETPYAFGSDDGEEGSGQRSDLAIITTEPPGAIECGNPFQSNLLETDSWSVVDTNGNHEAPLTESMEVNLGDDEPSKKWGRMGRLSGLVRRVKRMIGSSNPDTQKFVNQLPTIPDGQEQEETEELSGYFTCETPSPTAPSGSTPLEFSPRGTALERSISQDVGRALALPERDHRRAISVDSESGALSERNFMLAPLSAVATTVYESSPRAPWEERKSIKLPIKDLGNGRYLALGHLSNQGNYNLTVRIGKKEIGDGPRTISVTDPTTLGSGIADDGLFFQKPDSPVFPSMSTMLSPHPDYPPCHSVSYDRDRLEYATKHGHVGYVDVLFVVDCTASMSGELRQLPELVEKMEELMKEVVLLRKLRMAVIGYRDHHPEDEDNFLLRKQDFTDNIDVVKHFLSGLEADGKNDYPDAMEVAFEEAVEGVRWGLNSARFVIWVGDAPPHGYQGFKHKQAVSEAKKFKDAKARLQKAAYTLDVAMMNKASPRQLTSIDRDLADALEACETIGNFHDKYPLGIPGRVRWEEATERLSSIGARVIALGLRNAVGHQSSSNCLRTIAHISGGALMEVAALDASVIGPLTVAIVEQALDLQLVEEEVCDLILYFKNEFEKQPIDDRRQNLIEAMNQAAKAPQKLQVFPGSPRTTVSTTLRRSTLGSPSHSDAVSGGLFRPDSSTRLTGAFGPPPLSNSTYDYSGEALVDTKPLLLGMTPVRFDARALHQVLDGIRHKAENVSHCLISNFESAEQWFEFHTQQASDGLYKRERNRVSLLTAPLSLRYVLATYIMAAEKS